MSNDRKAVILGRLQRFTTVTPCPQASGPFPCCARAGARAAWTLAPRLRHLPGQGAPGRHACPSHQCVARITHETPAPGPGRTPANASHVFTE